MGISPKRMAYICLNLLAIREEKYPRFFKIMTKQGCKCNFEKESKTFQVILGHSNLGIAMNLQNMKRLKR